MKDVSSSSTLFWNIQKSKSSHDPDWPVHPGQLSPKIMTLQQLIASLIL